MGSQRSTAALHARGPACEEKPPGFGVTVRCSTLRQKRAAARPQLAGGEGLWRRLDPHLCKAQQKTRLTKARKRMIFGRASAHDVEAAR
jgi:hypothetical protein